MNLTIGVGQVQDEELGHSIADQVFALLIKGQLLNEGQVAVLFVLLYDLVVPLVFES